MYTATLLFRVRQSPALAFALSLIAATSWLLTKASAVRAAPARLQIQGPADLGHSARTPADVYGQVVLAPRLETHVLLTDHPPESPDGVDYGPLLRSGLQELLGRYVRLDPNKEAAVVLEVERLGLSCQVNAYKASCIAILQAKLWMPKVNLVLLQDKWTLTTAPIDPREGLTGKPLQDGALEQHRRRLHGLSRAARMAVEAALLAMNRDIESKQLVFDVGALRTSTLAQLQALWYRVAKAQLEAKPDEPVGLTVQQVDTWIAQGGCEPALDLPVCLSSLLDKGVLTKANVDSVRDASLRKAVVERLGVLFPGGLPSRVSVLVALQRAVYLVAVPDMAHGLIWQTDKDIRGLAADRAIDKVCVLLQDPGDAQAIAQCSDLSDHDKRQDIALPSPVQADQVTGFTLERGWLVVQTKAGPPMRISVAAAATGVAPDSATDLQVVTKYEVWLARQPGCSSDDEPIMLAHESRPRPVVLGQPRPVDLTGKFEDLMLDALNVTSSCPREVREAVAHMTTRLIPRGNAFYSRYHGLREIAKDWERLTKTDAQQAIAAKAAVAEAARQVAEAKDRAQRQVDSAKLLATTRKLLKQGKLDAAFNSAYAACERDRDNAEACSLFESLRQQVLERDQQRNLRAQAAAEERVLRQVPQQEQRCMAAYAEYQRAQQYARSAAASGGSRGAAAAERALQKAVVKVRQSQSGLRQAIQIYQQRGMQQAAAGVRERAAACLRL